MTYDPYKIKTESLEARILELERQTQINGSTQEDIIIELKKINMYFSEITGINITNGDILNDSN